ncbi:hypothetical protein FACS1894211_10080 [Clostridia bacterium]|nr:hypothetical protein FACS1894211_10080 [Clostridia bacterium]
MKKFLTVTAVILAACAALAFGACTKTEDALTVSEIQKAYTDAGFTAAEQSGYSGEKLLAVVLVVKDGDSALIYIFENTDAAAAYKYPEGILSGYQNAKMTGFLIDGAAATSLSDAKVVAIVQPLADLWNSKK